LPARQVSDGELRQPSPDIMRKLSGAKDKLALRVHGLVLGSPAAERARADPAVLRALCSHTLPSGKNEVLVHEFDSWATVAADRGMQFDWDDAAGNAARRERGLRLEKMRQVRGPGGWRVGAGQGARARACPSLCLSLSWGLSPVVNKRLLGQGRRIWPPWILSLWTPLNTPSSSILSLWTPLSTPASSILSLWIPLSTPASYIRTAADPARPLSTPPSWHRQAEIKRRRMDARGLEEGGKKRDAKMMRMPSKDASSFDK
jgi:hypothetical protein